MSKTYRFDDLYSLCYALEEYIGDILAERDELAQELEEARERVDELEEELSEIL